MCGRGKSSQFRLSPGVLLVLVLCVCSLAVHFIGEEVSPIAGAVRFDPVAQGGHVHLDSDHCEDHFVFPYLTRLLVKPSAVLPAPPSAANASSFSIPPLLPPPNF